MTDTTVSIDVILTKDEILYIINTIDQHLAMMEFPADMYYDYHDVLIEQGHQNTYRRLSYLKEKLQYELAMLERRDSRK